MQDKNQTLPETQLFQGLPEAFMRELAPRCHPRTIPGSTLIMMEHHMTPSMAVILRGTVKVSLCRTSKETLLNICGPGEVLGELNLVDGLGHSADILTLEESTLLWVDRELLVNALQTHPSLALNLARILSRRLRLATGRIEALTTLDVPGRVAHLLLNFAREYGHPDNAGGVVVPLCLTQGDLASLTGATRTRVNQVLMGMRRAQLISIARNFHITILNPAVLSRRYLGALNTFVE